MIIKLIDINENLYFFKEISEFNILSDLSIAASQLNITININEPINILMHEIELIDNDINIFKGYIDHQQIEKDINGYKIKFLARSYASVLLDNQASPQIYQNISLKEILKKHIYPYGFNIKNIDQNMLNCSLKTFTVFPFMSQWSVLETFMNQALNSFPYIIKEKTISSSKTFINTPVTVSNQEPQCLNYNKQNYNYANISISYNPISIISDIYIKTPNNYTNHIENQLAKKNKIKSIRYSNFPHQQINDQIKKQNTSFFSLSLVIPDLLPLNIGNIITVTDEIIPKNVSNNQFIIKKIYLIYKKNNLSSYLLLVPLNKKDNLTEEK